MLIDIIAGARPNFMKIAPIIHALNLHKDHGGNLRYRLVHTGQHYDEKMSGDFFLQLGIPNPDVNLGAGSGTQAEQTAAIMVKYEKLLLEHPSKLCIVVGDVTSTMACAITAQKLCIPVAHVEGGIRSGDWRMPEEINRLVTDSITNWFFTTSKYANQNLISSGVKSECIFFVGNTMIDTLLANLNKIKKPLFFDQLSLVKGRYIVLTLHRPGNVDEENNLMCTLREISVNAHDFPIIFPVHPRTANTLKKIPTLPYNIKLVEPQPYLEFIWLVKNSMAVITDSGGITEEATVLRIPCMTLRDSTERPETIYIGTNELIGTDPKNLKPAFEKLLAGKWKTGSIPEKWDGRASERIVTVLEKLF